MWAGITLLFLAAVCCSPLSNYRLLLAVHKSASPELSTLRHHDQLHVVDRRNGVDLEAASAAAIDSAPTSISLIQTVSSGTGRNNSVVSYSIYGNNEKYLMPLLISVRHLLPRYYPGWQIRIYHDSSVPVDFLTQIKHGRDKKPLGYVRLVNVEDAADPSEPLLKDSWASWLPRVNPMVWRLLVASDPHVDTYAIRDSDSVPNQRERAAVDEWLESGAAFHLMHDHPNHFYWNKKNITILGCCWGGRGGRAAPNMAELLEQAYHRRRPKLRDGRFKYGDDQDFLHESIWPDVKSLGPEGSV